MAPPAVTLNSGHNMPLVGFGLWKVNKNTCADQVYNAIKTGYRLFDGACDYGNEEECGEGVARAISDGLVERQDLFVVSKLWNSFHDADKVGPICKKQLADWKIDYFDLYMVHFPVSLEYIDPSERYPPGWMDKSGKSITLGAASIQETWQAMEHLVDSGLTRSIGVSNFSGQLLMDVLRYARIKPAALQIEHHPYLQQPGLLRFARDNSIQVTAYSSLGPASFLELDVKAAQGAGPLLESESIKKIALNHSKSPAQVLLRWATQRGIAVIPKSNDAWRLTENLDCCDFELGEEDMRYLNDLDRSLRFNDPINYGMNIPVFV